MKRKKQGDSESHMPQVCFRVPQKQANRLNSLGRIEKRKLPNIFRLCLNNALDIWDKTHPEPTGRKLKVTQ